MCTYETLSNLVNFCVVIFILKVEGKTRFHHFMIYYFKKGKNASEAQDLRSMWRRCWSHMSDVACQCSCRRFLTGWCSMVVIPVEVDNSQIKTLVENNQCYTTWEIADILKISKSSIENHLYQLMLIVLIFEFQVTLVKKPTRLYFCMHFSTYI